MSGNQWRRCSACKTPIFHGAIYWACSVSTCNQKRTQLTFCSVDCWDIHVPIANHRESWAVEHHAPATEQLARDAESGKKREPKRVIAKSSPSGTPSSTTAEEVLIVASRLKNYVRSRSDFNTSDRVLEPLSKLVRRIMEKAIQNARREGRQTVLDRDIPDDLSEL